ncbi:CBS domain-containing protein [Fictibacillus aquaticus]
MTGSIETCEPSTPIQEVASLMRTMEVGSIPVVENGELVGIVSDRDIVIQSVADGTINCTASDVMTRNPVTGEIDMTVEDAKRLMSEHQVRRLPIMENGRVAGIVSLGDLAVKDIDNNKAGDALTEISKS